MPQPIPFRILFVDDEEMTCKYFQRAFCQHFSILTAANVEQALGILADHADEIGIVISDHRMPGQTGVDLLKQVREHYPHMVRMLTTAYSNLDSAIDAVNRGEVFRYITKPWELDLLRLELNLAMRFFLLQRERDLLVQEKLSVGRRMIAMDRTRSLIGLCASFEGSLRYALPAIDAFLEDSYALETHHPPTVVDESRLDLWSLPADETARLITVSTRLAKQIQHGGTEFADELALPRWLDEAQQGHGGEPVSFLAKGTVPPVKTRADMVQRLLGILCRHAAALRQDHAAITVSTEPLEAVWQTPGVQVTVSVQQANWHALGSLLTVSANSDMAAVTLQSDLLAAYLLSYHHGGKLRVRHDGGSGLQWICELPCDPLASQPSPLDAGWVEQVFTRFEE